MFCRYKKLFFALISFICLSGCESNFFNTRVWLKKVDFQVDPNANKSRAFACHIVVPYSKDLRDRIASMDAQTYFSSINNLEKEYKDSLEIHKYDMIPGKNVLNQIVDIGSYSRAQGAFLFAKYSTQGKFMEDVGGSMSIVVKFLPYKIEVISANSLKELEESATNSVGSFFGSKK